MPRRCALFIGPALTFYSLRQPRSSEAGGVAPRRLRRRENLISSTMPSTASTDRPGIAAITVSDRGVIAVQRGGSARRSICRAGFQSAIEASVGAWTQVELRGGDAFNMTILPAPRKAKPCPRRLLGRRSARPGRDALAPVGAARQRDCEIGRVPRPAPTCAPRKHTGVEDVANALISRGRPA
jgi:hypothetical protein